MAAKKKEVKTKSNRKKSEISVKKSQVKGFVDTKQKVTIKKSGVFSRFFKVLLILIVIAGLLYFAKSLILAAMVNGKPITRLSVVHDLEKRSGKATLDNLVQKELILQEASKKGISVTDDQVQNEINRLENAVKAQGVTLDQALSYQGQTMEDLRENIKIQKMLEGILADRITVSEDDIKNYFDQNKNLFDKDAKLEDHKNEISDQLKQTKLTSEFKSWMDEVRKNSKIIYFKVY